MFGPILNLTEKTLNTMSKQTKTFTVADALAIQTKQVAELRPILSEKAFDFLAEKVGEMNAIGYNKPYDVFRGQDLISYVLTNFKD